MTDFLNHRLVIWEKACSCMRATATAGAMTWETIPSDHGYTIRLAYHLGPLCDVCRTPWKGVKDTV